MKRIITLLMLLLCLPWRPATAEIMEATRVSDVFPDPVLAQRMASMLNVNVRDFVTQEQLNGITTLIIDDFSEPEGVKNWSGIRHLVNLKKLDVCGGAGMICSLHEISGLTELETLEISNLTLSGDFESIAVLQKLENLNMVKIVFSNSATFEFPKGLKSLHLQDVQNASGSLETISGMNKLEDLYLYELSMRGSISSLSALTQLRDIDFVEIDVTGDLSDLSSIQNLESLELTSTNCGGDIALLSNMRGLRNLQLEENASDEPIREYKFSGNLSSLAALTDLESLRLRYTGIKGDISNLASLSKLRHLDLIIDFTGDIHVMTRFKNLRDANFQSPYSVCTLNEDFLNMTELRRLSTAWIDYKGDLSILGKLPACVDLSILHSTIELPGIEFITHEPIAINVPRIAEDRILIPQRFDSACGAYEDGRIVWNVPDEAVKPSGGQYAYDVDQHFENDNPDRRITITGMVAQPYKKPRTIVQGGLGMAGYSSIIRLESGKKYAISSGTFAGGISAKYRINPDGTVGALITSDEQYDALPSLEGNSIINLENYVSYTVCELSPDLMPTPAPVSLENLPRTGDTSLPVGAWAVVLMASIGALAVLKKRQ